MTYAPRSIIDLGRYWMNKGGVNLGIVGDTRHTKGYHLGRDRIFSPVGQGWLDYSVRQRRDRDGLSDAASAIDLGKLNGSLGQLWDFSAWLATRCMDRHPSTADIREVIFWDPEKQRVVGWSATSPGSLIPNYGDASHKTHTHISYFRDSESRDKVPAFAGYFDEAPPHTGDDVFVTTTEWCCEKHGEMPAGTRSWAATPPYRELDAVSGHGQYDAQVVIDQTATPHGTFLRLVTGETGRRLVAASSVTIE